MSSSRRKPEHRASAVVLFLATILFGCGAAAVDEARAQSPAAEPDLPAYTTGPLVPPASASYLLPDGSIRIVGTNTMDHILSGFNTLFLERHPGFRFTMQLKYGLMAIGPVSFGVTPFAPMPREFTDVEALPYKELVGREPLAIRVAHGTIISRTRTASLAIYVNKANPIEKLTVEQLARIFTTGHPAGDITHWGQLGLTGEWAKRAIHPAGTSEDSGFGSFMLKHKMGGRPLTPALSIRPVSVEIMKLTSEDTAGIGFCATNFNTAQTKSVAIAEAADGPYLTGSAEDVVDGKFPLDRYAYLYVRKLPGVPLEPWIADYLRLILSKEGQSIVAAEPDGYLPLNPTEVAEELAKVSMP